MRFDGLNPLSIKLEASIRKNKKDFLLETMDEDLANLVRQFCFRRKEYTWLFPNNLGNKISGNHFREYLASISERILNKRVTPHDFRHSLITEAGLKNIPIRDVMAITGHTDIDVLIKFYSHSTEQGRRHIFDMTKI